jgi:hypothetical protein
MTITCCKKDNQIAKPEFANIEFKLYDHEQMATLIFMK